jgi:RimJ/RimL family protein N-acetyltransferase
MKPFPTTFAPQAVFLVPDEADDTTREALERLQEKGFRVQLGLTRADTASLQALSVQSSVRKYCPKDCTERFKDEPTIAQWLTKQRLVFLLKQTTTGALAGIAWMGPGTSSHVPAGKLTGGIRLSETFQGLGLATPFLAVALEHTSANFSSEPVWFECWQSNAGALHIYQKLGFETVQTEPSQRLTPTGTYTPDVRVHMLRAATTAKNA